VGLKALALVTLMNLAPTAYSQQTIAWDAQGAILAGTGCAKDVDAFIMEAGNDLSIVFSNLGVELSDSFAPLAARKSCLAKVAARVASGYYVGTLEQKVSFGIVKSYNSEATVGVSSTFAGYRLAPLNYTLGRSQRASGEIQTAYQTDDFMVMGRSNCGRSIPPVYTAQLTAAGRRARVNDSVFTKIDGLDVRFEATAGIFRCGVR